MAKCHQEQADAEAPGTTHQQPNIGTEASSAVVKSIVVKTGATVAMPELESEQQIQFATQEQPALANQIVPPQIIMVPVDDCVENPLHIEIYGEEELSAEFLNSIKESGVMTPLLVAYFLTTEDGRTFYKIIAGHQRARAAKQCKHHLIPVIVAQETDDLKLQRSVISSNAQREKTNEQRTREFKKLKALETVFAARRMKHIKDEPGQESSPAKKGKAADLAAKEVGMSRPKATEMEAVVDGIDILMKAGREDDAADLQTLLNKKPHRAFKAAQEMGVIERKEKKPRAEKKKEASTPPTVESSPSEKTVETATSAAAPAKNGDTAVSAFEKAVINAKAVLAFVKSKAGRAMTTKEKDALDDVLTKTQGELSKQ
jgi:ParB-like chromosome segregation protein Spo0J